MRTLFHRRSSKKAASQYRAVDEKEEIPLKDFGFEVRQDVVERQTPPPPTMFTCCEDDESHGPNPPSEELSRNQYFQKKDFEYQSSKMFFSSSQEMRLASRGSGSTTSLQTPSIEGNPHRETAAFHEDQSVTSLYYDEGVCSIRQGAMDDEDQSMVPSDVSVFSRTCEIIQRTRSVESSFPEDPTKWLISTTMVDDSQMMIAPSVETEDSETFDKETCSGLNILNDDDLMHAYTSEQGCINLGDNDQSTSAEKTRKPSVSINGNANNRLLDVGQPAPKYPSSPAKSVAALRKMKPQTPETTSRKDVKLIAKLLMSKSEDGTMKPSSAQAFFPDDPFEGTHDVDGGKRDAKSLSLYTEPKSKEGKLRPLSTKSENDKPSSHPFTDRTFRSNPSGWPEDVHLEKDSRAPPNSILAESFFPKEFEWHNNNTQVLDREHLKLQDNDHEETSDVNDKGTLDENHRTVFLPSAMDGKDESPKDNQFFPENFGWSDTLDNTGSQANTEENLNETMNEDDTEVVGGQHDQNEPFLSVIASTCNGSENNEIATRGLFPTNFGWPEIRKNEGDTEEESEKKIPFPTSILEKSQDATGFMDEDMQLPSVFPSMQKCDKESTASGVEDRHMDSTEKGNQYPFSQNKIAANASKSDEESCNVEDEGESQAVGRSPERGNQYLSSKNKIVANASNSDEESCYLEDEGESQAAGDSVEKGNQFLSSQKNSVADAGNIDEGSYCLDGEIESQTAGQSIEKDDRYLSSPNKASSSAEDSCCPGGGESQVAGIFAMEEEGTGNVADQSGSMDIEIACTNSEEVKELLADGRIQPEIATCSIKDERSTFESYDCNRCTGLKDEIMILKAQHQTDLMERDIQDEEILSSMILMKEYIEHLENENQMLSNQFESQQAVIAKSELEEKLRVFDEDIEERANGFKKEELEARVKELEGENDRLATKNYEKPPSNDSASRVHLLEAENKRLLATVKSGVNGATVKSANETRLDELKKENERLQKKLDDIGHSVSRDVASNQVEQKPASKAENNDALENRVKELEEERDLLFIKIQSQAAAVELMSMEEDDLRQQIKVMKLQLDLLSSGDGDGTAADNTDRDKMEKSDSEDVQSLKDELNQTKAFCLSQEETITKLIQQLQESLDTGHQNRMGSATVHHFDTLLSNEKSTARIRSLEGERDVWRAKCIVHERTIEKLRHGSGSFMMPRMQENEELNSEAIVHVNLASSDTDEESEESIFEETNEDVERMNQQRNKKKNATPSDAVMESENEDDADSKQERKEMLQEQRDPSEARLHYLEDIIQHMTENDSNRDVPDTETEGIAFEVSRPTSWKDKFRRKGIDLKQSWLKGRKEKKARADGILC